MKILENARGLSKWLPQAKVELERWSVRCYDMPPRLREIRVEILTDFINSVQWCDDDRVEIETITGIKLEDTAKASITATQLANLTRDEVSIGILKINARSVRGSEFRKHGDNVIDAQSVNQDKAVTAKKRISQPIKKPICIFGEYTEEFFGGCKTCSKPKLVICSHPKIVGTRRNGNLCTPERCKLFKTA